MPVRIATFNIENLMNRFDFSGLRNDLSRDRSLALFDLGKEVEYRMLEASRSVGIADDTRQQSALAIAETRADILCLQEVDNLAVLEAFERGYLYRMVGQGYRHKYTTAGNDGRGIDLAIMTRPQTATGEPIEFVRATSHAHVTFGEMGLHTPALAGLGHEANERIFRRDCLEIDFTVGGHPLTVYLLHLKSMSPARDGLPGREASMPLRRAEALAVRRIIERRFGSGRSAPGNWVICGDLNDYRERLVITGEAVDVAQSDRYGFERVEEAESGIDPLLADDFAVNAVERRPPLDRWTLFHSRGPQERHLCQLDYILLSPALAARNPAAVPDIVRGGQPWRTPFPPGQEVRRYPRIGWDRPKASDHCPVAITVELS